MKRAMLMLALLMGATACTDGPLIVNPDEIWWDTGWDTAVDSGVSGEDNDADGWVESDDCDDSDPEVFPDAEEICNDGVDNDCDGYLDEEDNDCW
ncbi:MAG: putative metal-binding motif-containing protein [Myxococcota bacterium]|nr:putative metal-binding motif-containing protein [Myxococcota bacterium]